MNPVPLREVQATLGRDELLMEYVLGEKQSYGLALSKDSSSILILPPRATIEAVLSEFLNRIRQKKPLDGFSQRLFSILLKPVAAYSQARHLVIVPDGILHRIRFQP